MKKKILKITLSIVLILILAAGIGLTYLVGAAGGGGARLILSGRTS